MITLSDLDIRRVLKAEIQSNFDSIEAALPLQDSSITAVDYRGLKQNKIALQAEFGYPDEASFTVDSTATYMIIDQSMIDHVCTDTEIQNKSEDGGSVIHVTAYVYAIYDKPSTSGTLEVYLATYANGQWDIVPSTKRFVGYGAGSIKKVYTNVTETTDYMGNVTTWARQNMPFDYPVAVVAALGGDIQSGASNGRSRYGIAIDAVLATGGFKLICGNINLNARGA